ncbi:hypothetical protein ACRAWF_37605 [Streptomyces sp. L7]
MEAGLLEPHSADRYRFHDLVRAFAARRADREDPAADREAALVRLTMFLHATLLQAMSATERAGSLSIHLFSVPLTGLRFADAAEARTWLLAEHTLLVSVFSRVLRDIPDAAQIVVAALSVIASSGLFAGPAHQRELERVTDHAVAAADLGDDPALPSQTRHIRAWLGFIRGDLTAAETDLREGIRRSRRRRRPADALHVHQTAVGRARGPGAERGGRRVLRRVRGRRRRVGRPEQPGLLPRRGGPPVHRAEFGPGRGRHLRG